MNQSTVAIIGAGKVGATAAYALMMRNIVSKIMLVDINEEFCKGQVFDLSDAISFCDTSEIVHGTLQEAGQADIIVIAAGVSCQHGQSRLDILSINEKIITSILKGMEPISKQSIIIVITNPVDILTHMVQKLSGLPHSKVFGSGTFLDTQRLKGEVSKKINVDPRSIHLYVIGEHGDSQFVSWSSACVGSVSLLEFSALTPNELDEIAFRVRQRAYDIIDCKGSTAFGIAACISAYCQNIFMNQKRIVPVSCYQEALGVCLSMPVVLGQSGIEKVLDIPLNAAERLALSNSAEVLRKASYDHRDL